MVKKFNNIHNHFDKILALDRKMDGQTYGQTKVPPHHSAIKMKPETQLLF